MILPDWFVVTVLPILLFISALLWHIRNQRREIRKMKEKFASDKKEDDLLIKQLLRHD